MGPAEFSYFMLAVGVFVVVSCAADWDVFFSSRKALVPVLGRKGARIFWSVLGIAFIGFGAACLLGLIQLPPPK